MLSLEETIKHCEEVAEKNEKECSLNQESFMPLDDFMKYRVECLECAQEHRQLAEWLKCLKEIWDSGDCNDCLHQNNCTIRPQPGQLVRFNCYQYERRGE